MTYKPNIARKARLEAGSRPSLPGQDPMRESELRLELVEEFKPEGRVERVWVEDIAYRSAAVEFIRAQIAGFRRRLVQDCLAKIEEKVRHSDCLMSLPDEDESRDCLTPFERAALGSYGRYGTTPTPLSDFLKDPVFAVMLGQLSARDANTLRLLQIHEHEEVRERDRIIHQFERRRRQALLDAVELVEARRLASLNVADEVLALEGNSPVEDAAADAEAGDEPVATCALLVPTEPA